MSDDRTGGSGAGEGSEPGRGGISGEPPIQPGTGAAAAHEAGREVGGERPDGLAPPPRKGALTGTIGCLAVLLAIAVLFALFYGYRS